jgi:hypothetical protein
MTDGLIGGCACGAVRYSLASSPMLVNCCHCRGCQRQRDPVLAVARSAVPIMILLTPPPPVPADDSWSAFV